MASFIDLARRLWNPPVPCGDAYRHFVSPVPSHCDRRRLTGLLFTGRYRQIPFTIQRTRTRVTDPCHTALLITVRPTDWRPPTEITVFEGADNLIHRAVCEAHDCIDLYFDCEERHQ